jgi:hypothetical protein
MSGLDRPRFLPDQQLFTQFSGCDEKLSQVNSFDSPLLASNADPQPATCKIAVSPRHTYLYRRQWQASRSLKNAFVEYHARLELLRDGKSHNGKNREHRDSTSFFSVYPMLNLVRRLSSDPTGNLFEQAQMLIEVLLQPIEIRALMFDKRILQR